MLGFVKFEKKGSTGIFKVYYCLLQRDSNPDPKLKETVITMASQALDRWGYHLLNILILYIIFYHSITRIIQKPCLLSELRINEWKIYNVLNSE